MAYTRKPLLTFYDVCGHVEELAIEHHKECSARHPPTLPTSLPHIEFPLTRPHPSAVRGEDEICDEIDLTIAIVQETCKRCLATPEWCSPLAELWITELRRFWKTAQEESQAVSKGIAGLEMDRWREAMEREWDFMTKLAAHRRMEEEKNVPFKDRLFVIDYPEYIGPPKFQWIEGPKKRVPTKWDESALLRKIDSSEMINNPKCRLCKRRVDTEDGRLLPCGHVFHKHCVFNFMDTWATRPRCPDCDERWRVGYFPNTSFKLGPAFSRRFGTWLHDHDINAFRMAGIENDDTEEEVEGNLNGRGDVWIYKGKEVSGEEEEEEQEEGGTRDKLSTEADAGTTTESPT